MLSKGGTTVLFLNPGPQAMKIACKNTHKHTDINSFIYMERTVEHPNNTLMENLHFKSFYTANNKMSDTQYRDQDVCKYLTARTQP